MQLSPTPEHNLPPCVACDRLLVCLSDPSFPSLVESPSFSFLINLLVRLTHSIDYPNLSPCLSYSSTSLTSLTCPSLLPPPFSSFHFLLYPFPPPSNCRPSYSLNRTDRNGRSLIIFLIYLLFYSFRPFNRTLSS